MLYHAYQTQTDLLWPMRHWARLSSPLLKHSPGADTSAVRRMAAACKLIELAEVTHKRPPWGITDIQIAGETVPVHEEVVMRTPFATLRRFRKQLSDQRADIGVALPQPKVLIAAPMSGHFATLLRDTVRTMLRDHDVHVTDWHNVRDVPLAAGPFGLDEYTEHLMRFVAAMGPNANIVAVCQPCVSALAAVSLMSEDDHPATPASLTLMAGPIDCRISPTAVNQLANTKPIAWFEKNLISRVPMRHAGAGRRVYPGFVQFRPS